MALTNLADIYPTTVDEIDGKLSSYFGQAQIEMYVTEHKVSNYSVPLERTFDQRFILPKATQVSKSKTIGYSIINEEWDGYIYEVLENKFRARLTIVTRSDSEEIDAEFSFSDIDNENDIEFVEKGARFYWTIGHGYSVGGTRTNVEKFTFVKLPTWEKFDIEEPSEIASAIFDAFNPPISA